MRSKCSYLIGSFFLFAIYPLVAYHYAQDSEVRGEEEGRRQFTVGLFLGLTGIVGCLVMIIVPPPEKLIVTALWTPIYLLGWMIHVPLMIRTQERWRREVR